MCMVSNALAAQVSQVKTVDDAINVLMQLPRGHALVIGNGTHWRGFCIVPDEQPRVSMIVGADEQLDHYRPVRWFVFQEYIRYALETHTSCTISYPPEPVD